MEGQGTTMKMAFNPFDNHSTSWTNVIDELNTPGPYRFTSGRDRALTGASQSYCE